MTIITERTIWEVQQHKYWAGLSKVCWSGLNIISEQVQDMLDMVEYLERNNPEGVYRIWPTKMELSADEKKMVDQ